jgi:hypothetical protein
MMGFKSTCVERSPGSTIKTLDSRQKRRKRGREAMIIGEEEMKKAIADNLPNGANIKVSRKMTRQKEYEIKQIKDLIET